MTLKNYLLKAIGRNAAFHGEYEQPLVALKPGESTELSDGDIIGFRHDSYVYRLFIKPKIDLQTDQENNPEIFGAVDANWTSGSATPDGSDHEREIIVDPAHPVTGRIRPIPCEYGDRCFRRNPIHKQERCHPGDDDWWDPLVDPPVSDDPRAGTFQSRKRKKIDNVCFSRMRIWLVMLSKK